VLGHDKDGALSEFHERFRHLALNPMKQPLVLARTHYQQIGLPVLRGLCQCMHNLATMLYQVDDFNLDLCAARCEQFLRRGARVLYVLLQQRVCGA